MAPNLGLVFDVNIWVDAAIYLDSAGSIPQEAGRVNRDPYLASAMCFKWFMSETPMGLLLYSDDLILEVAHRKLIQPKNAMRSEDRGFGWESINATARLDALVHHVDDTGRSIRIEPPAAAGEHGDDYEDRRVFGVLKYAASHSPHNFPLMITGDGSFNHEINRTGSGDRRGAPKWGAMSPYKFVETLTAQTTNSKQ